MTRFIQETAIEVAAAAASEEWYPPGFSVADERKILNAAANEELVDLYQSHLLPIHVGAWQLSLRALAIYGQAAILRRNRCKEAMPLPLTTGMIELSSSIYSGAEDAVPVMRITASFAGQKNMPRAASRALLEATRIPSGPTLSTAMQSIDNDPSLKSLYVECVVAHRARISSQPTPAVRNRQQETYYGRQESVPTWMKRTILHRDEVEQAAAKPIDVEAWTEPLALFELGGKSFNSFTLPRPIPGLSRNSHIFDNETIDHQLQYMRESMAGVIGLYELIGAMDAPLRDNPLFKK